MKTVFAKIRNNSGESLAETLVAVLISVMGIALLAVMIQSTSNLITRSNERIQEYVRNENMLIEQAADKVSGTGTVTLWKEGKAFHLNPSKTTASVNADYFVLEYGKIKVISFKAK